MNLDDAYVALTADLLDDLEQVRISTAHRLRQLRELKGASGSPEEKRMEALLAGATALEHQAILELQRAMRAHRLGDFVKRTVGVGEKQAARLLGAIGDPGARATVSKLWAYCGLHTVPVDHSKRDAQWTAVGGNKAPRRQRGVRCNWNTKAKTRAYLIAESCIKQRHSPYRAVYDRERAKWADRDTTDGHRHAHALRVVSKEVLKDLWRESRKLAGQSFADAQYGAAGKTPPQEPGAA